MCAPGLSFLLMSSGRPPMTAQRYVDDCESLASVGQPAALRHRRTACSGLSRRLLPASVSDAGPCGRSLHLHQIRSRAQHQQSREKRTVVGDGRDELQPGKELVVLGARALRAPGQQTRYHQSTPRGTIRQAPVVCAAADAARSKKIDRPADPGKLNGRRQATWEILV